jgi:hypothetical protein
MCLRVEQPQTVQYAVLLVWSWPIAFFMVRIVLCVIDSTNIIRFIILVKYFAKYFQKKFAQQKSPAHFGRAVMSHEVMYIVALSWE